MKINYNSLKIFSVLYLLCSCHKESSIERLNSQVDVYVAGFEGDWGEPTTIAKYWKNGIPVNLGDGTKFTWANGIVVSGSDVYVSGTEYTDTSSVGAYWKNGTVVRLPGNDGNTEAFALAVSGQDVYVTGFEMNHSGVRMPVYWKNSIMTNLPGRNITPTAIAIAGTNLYITAIADSTFGDMFSGTYHMYSAVYWANGILKNLPTNNPTYISGSWAVSIAISGSDVFIAGNENFGGISYPVMKYWKNGMSLNPMGVSGESWARSIAVSNDNVYIAGWDYNGFNDTYAAYWKNDSLIRVGTKISYANSIAVSGNDVYTAGEEFNGNNLMATYWKNNIPMHLTDGSKHAEALSICLSRQ